MVFEFFLVLVILSFVIVILVVDKVYHAQCGIPIREWIIGLAAIYILWRLFGLLKIAVLKRCYQDKNCWGLSIFGLGGATIIAWMILGNVWFFSEENNCNSMHDTLVLYYLMLIILISGYIFIVIYLLALIVLPCIYTQSFKNPESNQLFKTLQKTKFNPYLHKFDSKCIVCKQEFNIKSKVSVLPCSNRHYMHPHCLKAHINKGNKNCLFCGSPIPLLNYSYSEETTDGKNE